MTEITEQLDTEAVYDRVSDAISNRAVIIEQIFPTPITFNGVRMTKLTLKVYPILVGNMYRIAKEIKRLPGDEVIDGSIEGLFKTLVYDHYTSLIYIAATGVQNNYDEPEEDLIRLLGGLENEKLFEVFDVIMSQVNLKDFINSIILIKGANVLKSASKKMSPESQAETIAPGE